MGNRDKVYVAFDGDRDIRYYWMMKAWSVNEKIDFEFSDVHETMQARDTSLTESIKASLRERMKMSKLFILLIGEHTRLLTRFVEYEVETAMRQKLPIICVNLNGSEKRDYLAPKWLDNYPTVYIPFNRERLTLSMALWPRRFEDRYRRGILAPCSYKDLFTFVW